jgi:hypothetical protein
MSALCQRILRKALTRPRVAYPSRLAESAAPASSAMPGMTCA